MTIKGHMLLANAILLTTNEALKYYNIQVNEYINIAIFYPMFLFGVALPDIDEPHSYIGRKLKTFSFIISSIYNHRTFTHYLFVPILLFCLSFFTRDVSAKSILIGIATGMITHDIGDMLTKGGIKGFFFPLFPNTKIALLPYYLRFYTNSSIELFIIYLILLPINIYLFSLNLNMIPY